jgi:hypothetical protein
MSRVLTPPSDKDDYTPLNTVMPPGAPLQYKLTVGIADAGPGTILLSTPVVDDVTIYTSCGHVHFTYFYTDLTPA